MHIPNENGVYTENHKEIIARRGRAYAAVKTCQCEDGMFRYGLSLSYSYGGLGFPIFATEQGFTSQKEATEAGTADMLRHLPKGNHGEPQSVLDELRDLRAQIEGRLSQPTLF